MSTFAKVLGWVVDVAVLGVALICAVGGVGAQGGRWNDRLDLLTHFAPVWLVGGLFCLAASIFLIGERWIRAAGIALSAVAAFSSVVLMWTDLSRLRPPVRLSPGEQTFKVIEYNTWGAHSDPAWIAAWIARERPDVAILLESGPELAHELAQRTGLFVFEGDGAVIATRRMPVVKRQSWDARFLPGSPTGLNWVDVPLDDGRIVTIAGVHCGWPIPSRLAWSQDARLTAFLQGRDRSTLIMAGDFNSTQWSFRQRTSERAFALQRRDLALPTWPARLAKVPGLRIPVPILALDHVYAGRDWKTLNVSRGPDLGSDHYPVVATLARRRD